MANNSTPFGFRWYGKMGGPASTIQTRRYIVPSSDGTAIYVGDAVKLVGTNLTIAGMTGTNETLEIVAACSGTSDVPVGVVTGVDPISGVAIGSENFNRIYRPASTQMVIEVIDDPYATFYIMSNGTAVSGDTADNFSINFGTAGSTSTGLSGMQLDESTHATTSTLQLKAIGQVNTPSNTPNALNTIYQVMFNIHAYKAGVTGFGS